MWRRYLALRIGIRLTERGGFFRWLAVVLFGLMVFLTLYPGHKIQPAQGLTFADLCAAGAMFSLKQTGTGVEVYCPGVALPVLTIKDCFGATATRDKTTGKITLNCRWRSDAGSSSFGMTR